MLSTLLWALPAPLAPVRSVWLSGAGLCRRAVPTMGLWCGPVILRDSEDPFGDQLHRGAGMHAGPGQPGPGCSRSATQSVLTLAGTRMHTDVRAVWLCRGCWGQMARL